MIHVITAQGKIPKPILMKVGWGQSSIPDWRRLWSSWVLQERTEELGKRTGGRGGRSKPTSDIRNSNLRVHGMKCMAITEDSSDDQMK